jgi:hypothetical protein
MEIPLGSVFAVPSAGAVPPAKTDPEKSNQIIKCFTHHGEHRPTPPDAGTENDDVIKWVEWHHEAFSAFKGTMAVMISSRLPKRITVSFVISA